MEIRELRATIIALFAIDDIDFKALLNDSFTKKVQNLCGCTRIETPLPIPVVQFSAGKIESKGKEFIIDRISIEERKIIVTIGGTSVEAHDVLNIIITLIESAETRHACTTIEPIIEVQESSCIAKMRFSFDSVLFGSHVSNIMSDCDKIEAKAPDGYVVDVFPTTLRFKITYKGRNEKLDKNHITLNDKLLSLEVREGTNLEDNLIVASGPFNTTDLISLLTNLEKRIV